MTVIENSIGELAAGAQLPAKTEIAIVGSGFSGLAMAVGLKRSGQHDFVVLERARDVGGTWRDNAYPGCACDVPSHLYSFSFAPNPDWSSTFSPQPEIQAYLRRVAEQQGVLAHVRFGCEVEHAHWDEQAQRWPGHPRPARLPGHGLSFGHLGPRPRPRGRARRGHWHRRERDPVRPPDPAARE
jgi:hypothetical protein